MNPFTGQKFHWGIIFSWDPDTDTPFTMHPFESLPEVPVEWAKFALPQSFRQKKMQMEITGKSASLFAKVEYGRKNCVFIYYCIQYFLYNLIIAQNECANRYA